MKIAIIGAGFVGLAAGYKLVKEGHEVTIFEVGDKPGGLAAGFSDPNWKWTLEEHYHHWFTSDSFVRDLAKEIGHEVIFTRPITSVLVGKKIYQLDSPLSLLAFPHLSLVDRLRTGATLAYLRYTPFWKSLENFTAKDFLIKTMGDTAWKILWEPLFVGKFGKDAANIPAIWFWARIKKRSASLGYPEGGFQEFASNIAKQIEMKRGKIKYGARVEKIEKRGKKVCLTVGGEGHNFNKVICTLPTPLFLKITKGLPMDYVQSLKPLKGLGAVTLVLATKKRFFRDGTYWLNVSQRGYPFLAVVEHTHLVPKRNYGNDNMLYVGNYLSQDHRYFSASTEELIDEFTPWLRKINPWFSKTQIRKSWVFKAPFAQPIVPLRYSKDVPPLTTPLNNLFLANMQQVYPWDRGTNYAVELGQRVAEIVIGEQ